LLFHHLGGDEQQSCPFDESCFVCYTPEGEEVVVVNLKLYYSTKQQPLDDPANHGFSEAMDYLALARSQGIVCEKVDTSELPNNKVYEAYADAWRPSISRKLAIRRVFGTRRRSGCFFGREVPALLVYDENGDHPIDVYPHEELGRIVTIREYVRKLLDEAG
jgi:hypothetical protein